MTIFNTPERQKIYRDIIKKLRLIDDAFFNSCFDGDIACMELLLQIIFGNPQLRVKEVLTQRSVPNLFGRGVRFDAIATDGERIFDVEVQRDDEGADPRRARYNSCMMDARELDKGKDFRELPETTSSSLRNTMYGKALGHSIMCRSPLQKQESPSTTAHILSTSMLHIKTTRRLVA